MHRAKSSFNRFLLSAPTLGTIGTIGGICTMSTLSMAEEEEKKKDTIWMLIRKDMDLNSRTNQAFITEFLAAGYNVRVIRPKDVDLFTTADYVDRHYPNIVFARTGARSDGHTLLLIRELERNGIPVINDLNSITNCSNKYLQYSLLNQYNMPVPKTYLLTSEDIENDENIEYLIDHKLCGKDTLNLKFPMVLKYCFGSGGVEVLKINNKHELETVLNIFKIENKDLDSYQFGIMIQEMIKTTSGESLRVIVIGDEVIASYYRKNAGDWRSNARQGSEFQDDYPLSEKTKKLCIDATKLLGLGFSGIDLLFGDKDKDEWFISEVNSCSGFEAKDHKYIPQKLMDYLIKQGLLDDLS